MKITISKLAGVACVGGICSALLIAAADAKIFKCVSEVMAPYWTTQGSNGSMVNGSDGDSEFMAVCSTTSGTSGTTASIVARDGYYGSGASYCWCRMLRPMVSVWVCTPVSSGTCAANCARTCANVALSGELKSKFLIPIS